MVKPYSPDRPSPKQQAFLNLEAEEALFGGAGGGGKSSGLILGALQHVHVTNFSAAIFRRTKEDLNKPGSILDRARMWFAGTAARWDSDVHGFRFPSYDSNPGATIHFGYAQTKQEIIDRYQSTEFQYIGVDELSQWLEDAYSYLFSRLRRNKSVPVPPRMRAGTNPGGRGAEWVRKRFIEFARHVVTGMTAKDYIAARNRGEDLPDPPYFESPPSAEAEEIARLFGRKAQGAFFVPAFKEDNPGLDLVDYQSKLIRMGAADRAAMDKGDWWASTGGKFFQREYFKFIEAEEVERLRHFRPIRVWDLAATKPRKGKDPDWSAGVKLGTDRNLGGTRIIITNARRTREDPGGVEKFVRQCAEEDGKKVPVHIEQEPGSAGKNNTHNYASKVLPGWMVHGQPKTGNKTEYWKPLSADAENGLVWLVRAFWNDDFINELVGLTDDDSHAHDDFADAASMGRSILLEDTGLQKLRNWKTHRR